MPSGNNPLASSQNYFSLLGAIGEVWQEFSGIGTTVAVYDTGIETTHPDLSENYDATLELSQVDGNPNSPSAGHGTAVAGIIAAADNDTGGLGVAYGCTIVSVDYLGDAFSLSQSAYIGVLDAMAQFDVVNCSWGAYPTYDDYNNIGADTAQAGLERAAIERAAENGRGGLGTIMTKAAGNFANDSDLSAFGILGSSQGDGLNSIHEFITVGATDMSGGVASYSNWGLNLLVAAPAANVTTDMSGSAGYGSDDYITSFGGTSAATPVVSGVVALMLEANPELHWRDVQNILASSAAQTGSNFGSARTGYEAGEWFSNGSNTWNGGGMTYHVNYGYGMVDAFAAVRMSEVWRNFYPDTGADSTSLTVTTTSAAVPVPDLGAASLQILVEDSAMLIDHVYVDVDFSHSWKSDTTIELIAPDGSVLPLLANEFANFSSSWTFGVSALRNTSPDGIWELRISDDYSGDAGTLSGFSLNFQGSSYSNSDVYTFTNDFWIYANEENERTEIQDENGGEDWLNLAALTGNAHVSMRGSTSYLKVDTDDWATLSGSIENIASGSGQDTLGGNENDNWFLGARGNDVIIGEGGRDTLEGGPGNDSLTGDAGDDSLFGNAGADSISGGIGTDFLDGGSGDDFLHAGSENDVIRAGTGDDLTFGGTGADAITGDIGLDTLYGDAGNDTLNGGNNSDSLFGGSGDDRMLGERGYDHLHGGDGSDRLLGGAENDWLYGDEGADVLLGGTSEDRLFGGGGNDDLHGEGGFDRLEAGSGDDVLFGGRQADNLFGDDGNDSIYGGEGLDRLFGGAGNDLLWGEDTGDGLFGGQGSDTLHGGSGNDRFFGSEGNDWLSGDSGDDTLYGNAGFDTLEGGRGNDVLSGNFNADCFVFTPNFGNDTITDFDALNPLEKIDLSGAFTVTDFDDLCQNHMSDLGSSTLLFDGMGNSLLLSGVSLGQLDANDFLL